jgi:hypothetical protein
MRVRVARLASVAVVALMLTGCGQRPGAPVLDSAIAVSPVPPASTHAAPTVSPSPTVFPSSPASGTPSPEASPPPSDCSSTGVTLTNADNGETLCVRPGSVVLVLLSSAVGDIRASGPLATRPGLLPTLLPGVKGAAFAAGNPGVASISAVLSPCGTGPGIHCMLLMLYRVTVDVVA